MTTTLKVAGAAIVLSIFAPQLIQFAKLINDLAIQISQIQISWQFILIVFVSLLFIANTKK